ncbi:MAG: type II toxin-antitoxin system VapC family toxin [Acetobacteraceae bacterium]
MSLYLDASVLMPTLVAEPATASVGTFLLDCADSLTVSELAAAEVASALSRLVRMGHLTGPDATERLADFDGWRASGTESADLDAHDCRLAHNFVRRFDLMLRAPDALHVAICRRLDLALVTLDQRLARAARALGVTVHVPTDPKEAAHE